MRHFKIFLASPGDTAEERKLAEEVVLEINRTIGSRDEFHLELLKWEYNTYPSIGIDGQDVISKQIGGDYQIFIGLMWKKFGTPTKRAGSGTEEEFELAYDRYTKKKDIQIMFYFNSSPIPQDSNLKDFQKVLSFKKKIEGLGAYHFPYENAKSFEKLLREHLISYIKDLLKSEAKQAEIFGSKASPKSIIPEIKNTFKAYLNDMEATFAHSNVDKVQFEDIYISPDLQKLEKNRKSNINKTIKLSVLTDAIDAEGIKYVFLGNDLAGKTASCKYTFQKYFNQSLIPVIITGEEINNNIKIETIEKIIEKNIINQYEEPFLLSEIDSDRILLIIDDFHKSAKGLNKYWHTLIRNIESKFKNVILTGSSLMTIDKEYNEPFKNFTMYLLLEFGPVLRKELVHKWMTLNIDEKFIDKNELFRKEDEALQHIKTAIGKNYFPVFPFYILSMLQALEGNTVSNPNYSIHGFYYENLISRCFSRFITNKKEINLFYNYLSNRNYLLSYS